MQKLLLPFFILVLTNAHAQIKKPLDHSVYDNWKSLGERVVSNDGSFVVYTVDPQEGDGELVIQNPATKYKKVVPRGYNAVITEDSKFLIFKIKPFFKDTRQAKIKKKKADDMPKDSIGIIELGKDEILKKSNVKSFKTPAKGSGFVAYHLEKTPADSSKKKVETDSAKTKNDLLVKLADSLIRLSIDSIYGNISKEELGSIINKAANQILKEGKDMDDADGDEKPTGNSAEGTNLLLRNLANNNEIIFKWVNEYYFDKSGTKLLVETSKRSKDSSSKALLLLYHLQSKKTDTLMVAFNDAKNFAFDESGNQLAFVAERDSSEKALQKFYGLWYFTAGKDSALMIADKNTVGMQLGFMVSENGKVEFSKDGSKLYFGTAPIRLPKDTMLVDFELAKVDVWNYKDDYLQTQQLKNLETDLKKSYGAVYHLNNDKMVQLGAEDAEDISIVNEGNAGWVLAESNKGNRVESQWTGRTKSTAYVINSYTGERKSIFTNLYLNAEVSPGGKFVYWYNPGLKNYFTYEVATGITKNISEKIKVSLYDEDNDVPDLPRSYGVMGWHQGDSAIYIYDKFDVWRVAPTASYNPFIVSKYTVDVNRNKFFSGRQTNKVSRYISLDKDQRFVDSYHKYLFTVQNKITKESELYFKTLSETDISGKIIYDGKAVTARHSLSKNTATLLFSKENFQSSPNMFVVKVDRSGLGEGVNPQGKALFERYTNLTQLSDINPQQNNYNWGTAELYTWKAYTGKNTTGILYKPDNFDPKKKYPLICYFYEKLSDGLYNYAAPAPTPSRLNIPFFVSRGYIVLAPDISYTTGHPGNDAYNHIASGARALVKLGFVDSTKIGIQGQSWGGYQVAYLITKTKLFAAAWAGAPVANMTSAYGGIRWESGVNRQFQYEKGQSRIGATLWEKPQLYIENSPLFSLPKVQTPLVIMHNDADGAVPWYQGMELFTALRRLSKPVWMLNYNGEAHNLIERRNRKDIQIREQQFFDWLLKGERPATWLKEGVPAINKGKDWGLDVE